MSQKVVVAMLLLDFWIDHHGSKTVAAMTVGEGFEIELGRHV